MLAAYLFSLLKNRIAWALMFRNRETGSERRGEMIERFAEGQSQDIRISSHFRICLGSHRLRGATEQPPLAKRPAMLGIRIVCADAQFTLDELRLG
jgi:hypothetical protein